MTHDEIKTLAKSLMLMHGVENVSFGFHKDGPWRLKGATHFDSSDTPYAISIQYWWAEVMKQFDIRLTILHEIAHVKAGLEAAHGPLWAKQAIALGIEPLEKKRASVSRAQQIYVYNSHTDYNGLGQYVLKQMAGVG